MARGEGIHIEKKYKWRKQSNGLYTIFDVEILQPFERKFFVFEDGERKEKLEVCNVADLSKKVALFEENRSRGHYPRIIIGHQDFSKTENSPGVGYLDNLNLRGETVFSDLTEMPYPVFCDIKIRKYPYRSVEIHPTRRYIDSLALLESRSPYFLFPMLVLEDEEEVAVVGNDSYLFEELRERALQFQEDQQIMWKSKKARQFQDEPDESKKEILEDEDVKKMEGGDIEGMERAEDKKLDAILDGLSKLSDFVRKLVSYLYESDEEEGEEPEDEEIPEMDDSKTVDSDNPSSVAFQSMKNLIKLQRDQAHAFEARIAKLESEKQESAMESELMSICDENPSIQFEANRSIMRKYSTDSDRRIFLDHLRASSMIYPASSGSAYLEGVGRQYANRDRDIAQQFASESPEIQTVAKLAGKDWYDTINQRNQSNALKFQKQWPEMEDYVNHAVNMEKDFPGWYENEMREGK